MHAHSATGRNIRQGLHQQWDGRKPAWGYASLEEQLEIILDLPFGFPINNISPEEQCFGQLVVAAINYDFVGTD